MTQSNACTTKCKYHFFMVTFAPHQLSYFPRIPKSGKFMVFSWKTSLNGIRALSFCLCKSHQSEVSKLEGGFIDITNTMVEDTQSHSTHYLIYICTKHMEDVDIGSVIKTISNPPQTQRIINTLYQDVKSWFKHMSSLKFWANC